MPKRRALIAIILAFAGGATGAHAAEDPAAEQPIRALMQQYVQALHAGDGNLMFQLFDPDFLNKGPELLRKMIRQPKTPRPDVRMEISGIAMEPPRAVVCGTISGIELGDIDPATGHAATTNRFRQILVTANGSWKFAARIEVPPSGPCDRVLPFVLSAGPAREINPRTCDRGCCCKVSDTDPKWNGFMTRRFCQSEEWCRNQGGTCIDKSKCVIVDLECVDGCCCEHTPPGASTQTSCAKEADCVAHGGRCLDATSCGFKGTDHSENLPLPGPPQQ